MKNVQDIRNIFIEKYKNKEFIQDRTGVQTIEIIGESFIVNEDWIIRKPNYDYIKKEIEWYNSQSLFVDDIPGITPRIWNEVASNESKINSNYGWCIFSNENGNQYRNVKKELIKNPNSRRAIMIYNRPSMHYEYNKNGMNDFICTTSNQFFIRNNKLFSHYVIRSNDAVFGFNNDNTWAKYIHEKLAKDLNMEVGDLIWTAGSIHVYERHFNFIEKLINEK